MNSVLESDASHEETPREKVGRLLSKFKGRYDKLSEVNPRTNRLFLLEAEGLCCLEENEISELQDDLEEVRGVRVDISSFLLEDSSEMNTASNRFGEIEIDWVYEKISYGKPCYNIMTFDHLTRSEQIINEGVERGSYSDNTETCAQLGSDGAFGEFEELVQKHGSDIEKVVAELGKIVNVLEFISQHIHCST